MNHRLMLAVMLILATVRCAEAADRRRAVRTSPAGSATLSGRAVDAQSGAAVFEVVVKAQGKKATADRDGSFTIDQLTSGDTTVEFSRWGYEPVTRPITLREGANSLNVSMAPKPIVTLTDTSDRTQRLDYDSVNFVYRPPLGSYTPLIPIDLCKADGTPAVVEKSQLAILVGPGRVLETSPCCPNSRAMEIGVVLKSGESFTAVLPECKYYRIDLIGRDRDSGEWRNLGFDEVARVEFVKP